MIKTNNSNNNSNSKLLSFIPAFIHSKNIQLKIKKKSCFSQRM